MEKRGNNYWLKGVVIFKGQDLVVKEIIKIYKTTVTQISQNWVYLKFRWFALKIIICFKQLICIIHSYYKNGSKYNQNNIE